MRAPVLAFALALVAASPAARIRHEGTFAKGAAFDRFTLRQTGAETFDLEMSAGKTPCTYRVGWIQIRPNGLVRTVDFQAELRGACAISPAPNVDGAIVLDRDGAGGIVRLLEKGAATELAVDRAWERR